MKRTFILIALLAAMLNLHAQQPTAQQILDKTAALVSRKNGCTSGFTFSHPQTGKVQGTIALKGVKYKTQMADMTVWFDGKTQWTYQKSHDEVTIATPTAKQKTQMNPYYFLSIYKKGYTSKVSSSGKNYVVTLTATNKSSALPQIVVTVRKTDSVPVQIKLKQQGAWTVIDIYNFKTANQQDSTFVFNKKNYPNAELIDLR